MGASNQIEAHFRNCLGLDVDVSVSGETTNMQVTLYRREKLADPAVGHAVAALKSAAPHIARNIGRVLVSYEARRDLAQGNEADGDFPLFDQTSLDVNFLSIERSSRFFSSVCPVCKSHALEAEIDSQCVEIQCGRCGGFQMVVVARRNTAGRSGCDYADVPEPATG